MANEVNFTSPYAAQEMEIQRRQQMAQYLQQQSQQQDQQQTAGGWVIPTPKLAGLNKVLQGALAGYNMASAGQMQQDLSTQAANDRRTTLADALRLAQGSPASPGVDDPVSGYAPEHAAKGPDLAAALARLSESKDPMLAQAGMNAMLSQMQPKAPIKLGQGDVLIDPRTLKPVASAPKDTKYHVVQGNLVPEPVQGAAPGTQVSPVYTAPEKDEAAKFNAILKGAGIDPASPQGQQLFTQLALKTATHQPANNVVTNVSTEKKYGEQFAGQIAKADSEMRDAAIKAPQLAERSNQVLKLLSDGKVITGTGADFRLAFAKAAKLAGVGNGTAADTEQVSVALAQNTLDAIKASGLGSGSGFSNADRDFLEKAVGGKINLEKETLQRLATLSHKAAVATADKWNNRVKQIPKSALDGTGITQDPTAIAPIFGSGAGTGAQSNDPLGIRPR